ncbi:MAG: terminase large subunit [Chloroflexi bacterium]|nr:terminase large subunit [Chloroflexota bacterium]
MTLPRWETPVPAQAVTAGDGETVAEFVSAYGSITKDSLAGKSGAPLVLRPWQTHVLGRIFARDPETGRRRHRRAMVGVARKNGKTEWAAAIALYGLLAEGNGAEVYSCAADRKQAKLVHTAARRMVEASSELRGQCRLYVDAIEVPATGSVYRALSSEAFTKEGLSPTLVVYDELHAAPDRELYDVMSLAMGARVDPLMLIVTTAGVRVDRFGQDTIAHQLYQLGKRIATGEHVDPTYYMAWWESEEHRSPSDEEAWAQANPSLGDILDPADMRSALPPATPENEYLTKRHNRWVVSAKSWLPHGAWDACKADREVRPDEPVILGFDGSWTNDSTALVGCTVTDPHIFVIKAWERPLDAASWVVPSDEVEAALRDAIASYRVLEVACDPHYWRAQLVQWAEQGWPVVEWPTNNVSRMVPACREFYTAVVEKRLTHSDDPALARHIANAVIKEDTAGARIVKQARGQKIDLAVASVIAYDRAHVREAAPVVTFIDFEDPDLYPDDEPDDWEDA